MAPEDLISFTRALKGAPASVLVVLQLTGSSMTNRDLQHWTGYSSDTLTAATRLLVQLGCLVGRSPVGPWSLPGTRGLALPDRVRAASENPGSSAENFGTPPASTESLSENPGPASENLGTPAGNLGPSAESFGTPSSTRNLLLVEKPELEEKNLDLGLEESRELENLRTLTELGIREPARSRLARLPHVTPEYIEDQVEQALAQGQKIGAAIWRIEHQRRVPGRRPSFYDRDEVEAKIRRFVDDGP
jgi:hypothetical protein